MFKSILKYGTSYEFTTVGFPLANAIELEFSHQSRLALPHTIHKI